MKSLAMFPAAALLAALTIGGWRAEGPAPTASPSLGRGAATVTVTVTGGKVHTPAERVKVPAGRTVRIVVTSDKADEFHLHGYDREIELKPGVPGTLLFVADRPGVFEAELHHSGLRAFELQVG